MKSKLFRGFYFSDDIRRHLALCYHDINIPSASNLHQVSPDFFRQQIKSLIDRGYQFLSADEFLVSKRFKGLRKFACITFDDGYKSILIEAAPILKELGVPGTLFLNTRLLDGKIFWRDKIRILISNDLIIEFQRYLLNLNPSLANEIDFLNFHKSTKSNTVNSKELEKYLDSFFLENGLPLDDMYIKYNLTSVDLLKCDAEGAEP